jgi:hypothetical protein
MGTYPARTGANGRHIGQPRLPGAGSSHRDMAQWRAAQQPRRAGRRRRPWNRNYRYRAHHDLCATPVFASTDAHDAHAIAVAHGQTIAVTCTVAAALWLTMAYANYRARTDAPRIIAAVLFYLGTEDFAQYFKDPNTAATRAFAVVTWLVGLAVLVLLFSNVVAKTVRNRTARGLAQQLHDATSWVRPQ